MNKTSQTTLWIALALAIFLGALWQLYPLPDAKVRFDNLPINGPAFVGKDIPLTSFEQDFFKDVNILKRLYAVDKKVYFVTALDGTHNRHVVHDPYYCFRGSGWNIVGEQDFPLSDGQAKLVTINKGEESKAALYWFTNGTSRYASPWKYWWEATARRLTLGLSGPEPVLVIIQPLDNIAAVDWNHLLQDLFPLLNL